VKSNKRLPEDAVVRNAPSFVLKHQVYSENQVFEMFRYQNRYTKRKKKSTAETINIVKHYK